MDEPKFPKYIKKMFNAILKSLNLKKVSSDIIKFSSKDLKKNTFISDYLVQNKDLIGGELKNVIEDLENETFTELELAGGTITVPAGLACDVNLYNHFKEYFKIDFKIPMFLFHTIEGEASSSQREILNDYEVFKKTFNSSSKPQVISYFTFGPKLCWGRHSRWRAQFDIFDNNLSTAVTNHACHSWLKNEKIYCDLQGNFNDTNLLILEGSSESGTLSDIPICKNVKETKTNNSEFKLKNSNAFNFIQNEAGQLSGNHIISSRKRKSKLTKSQFAELQKFKNEGIIYNPYVMPENNQDIEFGMWWPSKLDKVELNYILESRNEVKSLVLETQKKVIYRSEITEDKGDFILWQQYPEKQQHFYDLNQPMLVCRNKISGDTDFTEFQSCWRNQGFESDVFPHWIGNFKAMKPSSRLTGVVNFSLFDQSELILQAVKPKDCNGVHGTVEINVYDRCGNEIKTIYTTVEEKKCRSFQFSKKDYGNDIAALRVRSTDIDFTANLLQWSEKGATSLQHLWGY